MAIRDIIIYGHPTLRMKSSKVEEFNEELKRLVHDMVETMYAEPGVGLAANQVDVPLQVAVVDITVGEDPDSLIVLVNPEITQTEGTQDGEEGCLSIPGIQTSLERPSRVTVRAQNLQGKPFTITGEGLLARAFCHEIDHLNGVLFIDHLTGLQKKVIQRKLQRMAKSA
ncbi:MAG TPA: peptide deformylase [Thermoanaerobaculia bacterium]|nr:peptide deformylase [Thermoanaerobaculia bacterium]HUM30906.1 peptide deformylase [Thermoanaerobaculia bacterium]HXK69216.1 peptide deformylase [Thermoanaerobaculia bacterium]